MKSRKGKKLVLIFICLTSIFVCSSILQADYVFVTNYNDNTVSIVNVDDLLDIQTVTLSENWPKQVVVRSAADYAFVTHYSNRLPYGDNGFPVVPGGGDPADYYGDSIGVIDLSANPPVEFTQITGLGIFNRGAPNNIIFNSDESKAYVSLTGDLTIAVINTDPGSPNFCTIENRIYLTMCLLTPSGIVRPWSLELSADGRYLYVVCSEWYENDRIIVVDTTTNSEVEYLEIGFDFASQAVTVNDANTRLYVPRGQTFYSPNAGYFYTNIIDVSSIPGMSVTDFVQTGSGFLFNSGAHVELTSDNLWAIFLCEKNATPPPGIYFCDTSDPATFVSANEIDIAGGADEVYHFAIDPTDTFLYVPIYSQSANNLYKIDLANMPDGIDPLTDITYATVGSGPLGCFYLSSSIASNPNVNILTTSIPNGEYGINYSATLLASGGVLPYSWAVTSGALPGGLSLISSTGEITGTPTESGTFNFTVTVTDATVPTPTQDLQAYSMDITTDAVAKLDYNPDTFTFVAEENGSNPLPQTLYLTNTQASTVMNWAVSDNAQWLNVGPASGDSTGETDSVSVSVTVGALPAGVYNATITVSGNATNMPVTIPVQLTITTGPQPPAAVFSPSGFVFYAAQGYDNPESQYLSIYNSGTSGLDWSLSEDVTWLTLIPASGTSSGETDEVEFGIDISGLVEGTYYANVIMTGNGDNMPLNVPVTLYVESPYPTINPYPTSFTFYASTDSAPPPYQTMTIWNSKIAPLNYTITSNAEWLSTIPDSGQSLYNLESSVKIYCDTSSMERGIHTGKLTISDPNATNNPQEITVVLYLSSPSNVMPPPELYSPLEAESLTDKQITFSWEEFTDYGDVTYIFQVDDNSDFSSPVRYVTGLEDPSYTVATSLINNTYYWRVRGVNDEGEAGVWSKTYKFTLGTTVSGSESDSTTNNSTAPDSSNGPQTIYLPADDGSSSKTCFIKFIFGKK